MKLPFDFSLKFIFRSVLPGFVLALALYPAVTKALSLTGKTLSTETVFIPLVLILGWLFVVMDMSIYMLYEGRRYWPDFLWRALHKHEQKRLARLQSESKGTSKKGKGARSIEALVELRDFPVNERFEYYVKYPTRLGNLLAAYEDYASRVYGMDSTFYWYRIWLKLDKDLREELDTQQAIADSAIYVSLSLFLSAVLGLVYACTQAFGVHWTGGPGGGAMLGFSCGMVLAGYVLYRASLHIHAQFGELFKSTFDVYSQSINVDQVVCDIYEMGGDVLPTSDNRQKYREAWRYLRYFLIKKNGKIVRLSEMDNS